MLRKSSKLFGLLKNEKNEIDAMLFYVSAEKFNRKTSDTQWSIAQIVEHIYLAESQTLAAILWRMKNKNTFLGVSALAYFKVYYTELMFKLPFKMKSPPIVFPQNEYLEKTALMQKWADLRSEWSNFIYTFPSKFNGRVVYKHPILGYLSLNLTLIFMYRHLLRHKLQLKNLVSS